MQGTCCSSNQRSTKETHVSYGNKTTCHECANYIPFVDFSYTLLYSRINTLNIYLSS